MSAAAPGERITETGRALTELWRQDVAVAETMQSGVMTSRIVALCFDANDPLLLARFWAGALQWKIDDETHDEIGLVPTDETRFRILFLPVPEKKTAGKNRIHLDLTSTSIDDQKETVERLVETFLATLQWSRG